MKMQRGAWRAALAGTDLEPKEPAPKINRGAPRKISNLHGRVQREVLRREAMEDFAASIEEDRKKLIA